MLARLMLPLYRQKRVQRLLRLGRSEPAEADAAANCYNTVTLRRSVRGILEQLDSETLKLLCDTVQRHGDVFGECVRLGPPMAPGAPPNKAEMEQLRLLCRFFRWPQLHVQEQLVRLPVCEQVDEFCVNPYHWSRVYCAGCCVYSVDGAAADADGYARTCFCRRHYQPTMFSPGDAKTEYSILSDESNTGPPKCDNVLPSNGCDEWPDVWCRIFYGEYRRRLGRLGGWPVCERVQNVFHSLPRASGLALCCADGGATSAAAVTTAAVAPAAQHNSELYRRRQRHIGAGLTLWLDCHSCVWLYNRSERPLFVTAAALPVGCRSNTPATTAASDVTGSCDVTGDVTRAGAGWPVHRLLSGHCVLIYRRQQHSARAAGSPHPSSCSPAAPGAPAAAAAAKCVTVSFAKGWGSGFRRSTPLGCPHWLEIWLCDESDNNNSSSCCSGSRNDRH